MQVDFKELVKLKLSNYLDLTVDFQKRSKYTQFQDGKLNQSQLLSRAAEGLGPAMPGNQQANQLAKVLLPTG